MQAMHKSVSDYGINLSNNGILAIIFTHFVWDPFIFAFLIDILLYHAWLKYQGLSTYDHIVMK
jgi:hypothetical protein